MKNPLSCTCTKKFKNAQVLQPKIADTKAFQFTASEASLYIIIKIVHDEVQLTLDKYADRLTCVYFYTAMYIIHVHLNIHCTTNDSLYITFLLLL